MKSRTQGQREVRALDVSDKALGVCMASLDAADTGDLFLEGVLLPRRLTGVREAGESLPGLGDFDVYVVSGAELHCVFAIGDFEIVEGETAPHAEPGVVDKHRHSPVIGVVVDRPVSEDDIRTLGLEDFAECVVVAPIDDRFTIDLTREDGPGLENLARFSRLGDASSVLWLPRGHTVVQIEKNEVMPQVRVARHCATAAILRISWMPTGDNHIELASCGVGQWSAERETASEGTGLTQEVATIEDGHVQPTLFRFQNRRQKVECLSPNGTRVKLGRCVLDLLRSVKRVCSSPACRARPS